MSKKNLLLNSSLNYLLNKYDVENKHNYSVAETIEDIKTATFVPGSELVNSDITANALPLLPWRFERRFIELKKTLDDKTLKNLCMIRCSCLAEKSKFNLGSLLYREIDLCLWYSNSEPASLFASIANNQSVNMIIKMKNKVVCSIEASLSINVNFIDKHELISERGMSSDRVVDSQIPQNSLYAFTENNVSEYTDTDAELYGLSQNQTNMVRAAFAHLKDSSLIEVSKIRHNQIVSLINDVFESDKTKNRISY